MKVLKNRILIKPLKDAVRTINGFEIPEANSSGTEKAEVIELGKEILDNYSEDIIHIGSTLLIHKGAGSEFTKDDEKYRTISESEVIVVLD